MKSIKIYLFLLIFFACFSTQVFSQNDFYNEKKNINKEEKKLSKTDSIIAFDYYTEEDYNELYKPKKLSNDTIAEVYYDDEMYGNEVYDDEENRKKRNNAIAGEIVAEIVYNVFINVAFIVAAFWH